MERHKNRLRVALVGSYPLDATQIRGGVQAATAYLVKGLAKLDHLELHILTLKPPGWIGPDRFQQDGMDVHLLKPPPRFERLNNYRTYQSTINEMLAQIQPDVVHAQEAAGDACVALRSGYPVVITAHGIRYEDRKYAKSWGQRTRLYFDALMFERYVMRRARYLIAISRYVTEYFAHLLRPDLHRYTIPNAIDERFFDLPDSAVQPVVLFVGRVIPLKRIMDLIQAFALVVEQIPLAQLRIAGECSTAPSYAELIRRWIKRANLEKNIILLGELRQEAVLNEYAGCRLLALSSSQENAPVVIAQAMAAGKPVVATSVGGVVEMVGEQGERGVLVRVGDVSGLAGAMLQLLRDPQLRARLGEAGRKFARKNYHLDVVAQRTFQAYEEIAAAEQPAYV